MRISSARHVLTLLIFACLPIAALGCGSGEAEPSAADDIAGKVADVSDASFDKQRFEALFVAGTAPPDAQRQRYRIYMFRTGDVDFAGDSATAKVEIEEGTSGKIEGEFDWTLRREADTWKFTAAPLPAP